MEFKAYFTDHFVNKTVMQFFAKSLNIKLLSIDQYQQDKEIFCSYGILRGTAEPIKISKNFIYLDHGFFGSSSRSFTESKHTVLSGLDGYFRIIRNDLYFNLDYSNANNFRFNKLNISLKDLNKNGEYIILSEPSENTLNFLELENWTNNTISELKKYTDRKIIVHNKFHNTPLEKLLHKAFAFVSLQSTAGFKAISEGVPAFFTHNTLKKYGDISSIEDRILNHNVLFVASNSQWRLREFFSDEFHSYIREIE